MMSDSEDEGCFVFWQTDTILPPAPPHTASSSSAPSKSQRSGAPSPSLGCTSTGTPKPKRTTSLASLPSPSASTVSTVRPLRQRKKRKPLDRRNAAPDPSSQPLDAETLRMVSQLAKKVNARAAGIVSPVVTRARQPAVVEVEEGKGKGKAAEGDSPQVLRQALRPSPHTTANTPLRRSADRSPRSLLSYSTTSTKPSLSRPSPQPKAPRPPPPPPPALVRASSSTTASALDDDDESYFDDENDAAFELALSQLDESITTVCTSQPVPAAVEDLAPPKPARAPAPAPARPAAPPRVAVARLAPTPPSRSSPRLAQRILPRSLTSSTAASKPAPPASRAPSRPPAPPPALLTRRSSSHTPAQHEALEALAQREAAALAELGDVDGWSDDDEF
ncbi:hypothetical protein JCM10207_001293 [Rhodosporidiobolus poonsookiae]